MLNIRNIIVNLREVEFLSDIISYRQVVNLAFPTPDFNAVYTIICNQKNGVGFSLIPEERVAVYEGMIFNVTLTNNA